MYSNRVSSPTCSPSWANQVLTELVSAVSRVIGPKLWLKSFCSGWPWTSSVPGASIVVSGVIVPLSSPAAAVTTLKVEPGGYWPWVARSSSGDFDFVVVQLREFVGDPVGVVRRVGGQHPHPAAARLDRDHGAEAGRFEVVERHPLRLRVDVGDDVVALLLLAPQLVEDRAELGARCRPARRCGTSRTRCRPGARSCSRSGARRATPPGSGARSAGRRRGPWRPSGRSRCRRRRGSARARSAAARAAAACWPPSPSAPRASNTDQ